MGASFSSISIKDLLKKEVNEELEKSGFDSLRKELDSIKKVHNVLVSEETLIKEWDNEDDAKWDKV